MSGECGPGNTDSKSSGFCSSEEDFRPVGKPESGKVNLQSADKYFEDVLRLALSESFNPEQQPDLGVSLIMKLAQDYSMLKAHVPSALLLKFAGAVAGEDVELRAAVAWVTQAAHLLLEEGVGSHRYIEKGRRRRGLVETGRIPPFDQFGARDHYDGRSGLSSNEIVTDKIVMALGEVSRMLLVVSKGARWVEPSRCSFAVCDWAVTLLSYGHGVAEGHVIRSICQQCSLEEWIAERDRKEKNNVKTS